MHTTKQERVMLEQQLVTHPPFHSEDSVPMPDTGVRLTVDITRQPVELTFRNLHYSVSTPQGDKCILSNASGRAVPGRLLALMGRSGAGKTTLLDTLAATNMGGKLQGGILVNGRPRLLSVFRRLSCYVMQKDVLLSTATVREALITSAQLRLPFEMSNKEKATTVATILEELGLQRCADTLIGDDLQGIKGISGGERRRTSMGLELVTDPSLIFLDEPTSGLDSDTACSIVEAMRQLAGRRRTVVCTIHQPNSDIVDMFEDLMLIAAGRVAYHGPFPAAVQFVADAGFPCPAFKNPADFFMSLFRQDSNATAVCDAWARYTTSHGTLGYEATGSEAGSASAPPATSEPAKHQRSTDRSDTTNSELAQLARHDMPGHELDGAGTAATEHELSAPGRPPIWYQTMVLTQRFFRTWLRNPGLLASELFQYIFFALSIGLMYLGLPDRVSDDAVFLRASSLWFILAALCFTPPMTAATAWDHERVLLKREYSVNAYHTGAFYLAKTLTTWPFEVFQTIAFVCIVYFMVGYQATTSAFWTFLAIVVVFQLMSETIGVLCATITATSMYAIILATVVLFFMLAFNGFLIPKTPIYFVWLQKISYLNFAFVSLMGNEFSGLELKGVDGATIMGETLIPTSAKNGYPVSTNLAILACMLVGSRILGYLQLLMALRLRWL